jgi:hypothetical protein
MEIPLVASEQYPKAFGSTIPELNGYCTSFDKCIIYPKKKFSMLTPECDEFLSHPEIKLRNQVESTRHFI